MYVLSWYIPDKVMMLCVHGDYTAEEAADVNRQIMDALDHSAGRLSLLIDAQQMGRPREFQEIRALQTYMNHPRLTHVYAVAADRVVRLALLVIFNLARAQFMLVDNLAHAERAMGVRG